MSAMNKRLELLAIALIVGSFVIGQITPTPLDFGITVIAARWLGILTGVFAICLRYIPTPRPLDQPPVVIAQPGRAPAGIGDMLPSGVAGTLNGRVVGQGVIDYCNAHGWTPLSNENYTEFPGCSETLCDKGRLTWAPSVGVQPTSFDQG